MRRFQAVLLALFSTLTLSALAGEFPDHWTYDRTPEARAKHAALEGKPMPPLDVSGWVGTPVTASEIKGKVVIVDFYATWCGPCMAAIPHNNEMLQKYKDQGLVIIGVCTSNRGQEKMAETAKARGMQYPTVRDPQLKSEKAWAVHYYPTYAVIDRKGIIRSLGVTPTHVEQVVKKLLDEKS